MAHRILLLLVLALLVSGSLAGCLHSPPAGSHDVADWVWGIGLDVPEVLPTPGPFAEAEDQVAWWDGFFRGNSTTFGKDCHHGGRVEVGDLVILRIAALTGCFPQIAPALRINDFLEVIPRRLDENRALLSEMVSFPNVPAVEVVAQLMADQVDAEIAFSGLEQEAPSWGSDEGDQTTGSLHRSMAGVFGMAYVIGVILEALPPMEGPCKLESLDIVNVTLSRYHELFDTYVGKPNMTGLGLGRPNDELGRLGAVTAPRTFKAAGYGWWPFIYRAAGEIPYFEKFFAQVEERRLPTYEEGQYLVALAQSEGRSLDGDFLKFARVSLSGPDRWGVASALASVAVGAYDWRFSDLSCDVAPVEAEP